MNNRIFKAAVGLLAAGTAVGLMSLPASANTKTFSIDAGVINLYNADATLQDTVTLGGDTGCGTSSVSITATGNGTSGSITGNLTATGTTALLGNNYASTLTATITGTYTSVGGGTYDVTLFIDASVNLDPGTNCVTSTTISCTITVTGIPVTGTFSGTLPTIATSDTAQLSGTSGPFAILVSPGCPGPISAINDGEATISGLTLTAL